MHFIIAALSLSRLIVAIPARSPGQHNGDCKVLNPSSNGTIPGDGSLGAYLIPNNSLSRQAQAAETPKGYRPQFINVLGASVHPDSYLTYHLLNSTYNTTACAEWCDADPKCEAFNIYFQRTPKYDLGPECLSPEPITNIKCALYKDVITEDGTTNTHQWTSVDHWESFQRAAVGSSGYNRIIPRNGHKPIVNNTEFLSDFNLKDDLYNAVIWPFDVPLMSSALGFFVTGYPDLRGVLNKTATSDYLPEACAGPCYYDDNCEFFNSFTVLLKDKAVGTGCSLWSERYGSDAAKNVMRIIDGREYTITNSQTYSRKT